MYNIYINLFILTVDLKSQKKYILSQEEKDINIPRIALNSINKSKIKYELSEYIRNIIPMNILGVLPQVINLHSQTLANTYKKLDLYSYSLEENNESNIESIYGCLVDYINPSNSNFHWIEFAYEIPNNYSANIFEVCQYLR